MYSLDILIGTGLCALVVGGLLGMLFGRNSTAGSQQARDLEKRVDELSRDKKAYENRVTEHFAETAERLNALTDMYRDIHEHLAEGASTLAVGKPSVTVKRLAGDDDRRTLPESAGDVEPPRDYAPKANGERGVLTEGFGLERDNLPGNRGPRDPDGGGDADATAGSGDPAPAESQKSGA